MSLVKCRLCGMLYDSVNIPRHKICPNCIRRLDELYGHVHEYMRDNENENFDIYRLAEAMGLDTADVQALVDLGYIERDLQTYSRKRKGPRGELADRINGELDKMRRNKVTTYGGFVYSREKFKAENNNRQYVYDGQKTFRR